MTNIALQWVSHDSALTMILSFNYIAQCYMCKWTNICECIQSRIHVM